VAALSAHYLDIEKQLFGLALLTLVLFFNFCALKFNVNAMLMPLWVATTLWFMRSQATRSALYAALAGCGAAAHMLGKYWSIFFIAGLVLATHSVLLYQENFAPFSYAVGIHGAKPFTETIIAALGYLAGSIGYAAVPVIIAFVAGRPGHAALSDMVWPAEAKRWLAAAFPAPLLLLGAGALLNGSDITSLWSMSAWIQLPVLLLSPNAMTISAVDTRRLLAFAAAPTLVMVIVSPARLYIWL